MINIVDKKDCCGCAACVQRCPKRCIALHEDNEGFLYPIVDKEACINCGLCDRVCPVINRRESQGMPDTIFALKHRDDTVRKNSSSGGAFTAIASKIIKEGGVVFGARFNDNWKVVHSYTENLDGLDAFRGSKYVQSDLGNSYKKVEEFLKSDRIVLFSGTPCQVSGLHLFLRKQYDKLYTFDFVCHGVPSPGIFRWYLQDELNKIACGEPKTGLIPTIHSIPKGDLQLPEGIEIQDIRFRDKVNGWKKFNFTLKITKTLDTDEKNTISLSNSLTENSYLRGFIGDIYLRPSCFLCPAKSLTSGSDFTVADFWGQEHNFPEFDNDTGVSAVIPHTDKAKTLILNIENVIILEKPFRMFLQYNPSIIKSVSRPLAKKIAQRKFWNNMGGGNSDLEDNLKKSLHYSFLERVIIKLDSLFRKQ